MGNEAVLSHKGRFLENLFIDPDKFLDGIEKVRISYD